MLKLIKKDFLVGGLVLIGTSIIIPFLTFISLMAMMDDFGGIVLGFFTFLILFICTTASLLFIFVDSTSNTEMTFASLPIERKIIVAAKYYSSLILTILNFGLVVITVWFVSSFSADPESDKAFQVLLSLPGIISMLMLLLTIQIFIFPFIFKFGSGKGVQTALIAIILLTMMDTIVRFIANGIIGYFKVDFSFIIDLFNSSILFINQLSSIELYSFLLAVFLIIISVSLLLSQKFYSLRDL